MEGAQLAPPRHSIPLLVVEAGKNRLVSVNLKDGVMECTGSTVPHAGNPVAGPYTVSADRRDTVLVTAQYLVLKTVLCVSMSIRFHASLS